MADWRPFVMGGTASIIAECGTFPIDTTKTRLQVQGQKIDPTLVKKYRGTSHALYKIITEEGGGALYKGLSVALLRQASYGTIKIGVYHSMKSMISPEEETLQTNVICGVTAGVVSSIMANPTDVLKVRLQAKNQHVANTNNLAELFATIYRTEGVKGMWRGVMPTAQRAAVVCGVKLPVYDISKKHLIERNIMDDGFKCHFSASFIAGLTGSLISNPIDVVKTRLMNQINLRSHHGGPVPVIYTSSFNCLAQTVRHEGVLALWKGFTANWLRLGPWNIIFFMTYEQLKLMCS